MRFLALDKLINLEDGYRKRFKIDSLELILVKEGNEFFAFGAYALIRSNHSMTP